MSALAGCESGANRDPIASRGPAADQALLASYSQPPSSPSLPISPKAHTIAFVRPTQGLSHIAVPVSLNDGPPHAFILDTGAPVTTVLISKQLLELTSVARKLDAARPTHIQGISGTSSTAYRTTARSIAVGPTRVAPFPYVLMSADRNLSDLGQTPYGPVVGILGNDFLSRYRVTVDYQSRTVTLEDR